MKRLKKWANSAETSKFRKRWLRRSAVQNSLCVSVYVCACLNQGFMATPPVQGRAFFEVRPPEFRARVPPLNPRNFDAEGGRDSGFLEFWQRSTPLCSKCTIFHRNPSKFLLARFARSNPFGSVALATVCVAVLFGAILLTTGKIHSNFFVAFCESSAIMCN